MRRATPLGIAILFLLPAAAKAAPGGAVPPRLSAAENEQVLFAFDDRALPFQQGLRLHLIDFSVAAQKNFNVVVPIGPPGSVDHTGCYYYGTVLRVNGELWMWYLGSHRICLAKSPDGVHWTKPSLGLAEFGGNRNNNLVELNGAAFSVGDPCLIYQEPSDPDSSRRFKMLFEAPQYHGRFSTAYSADGIHWREGAHNPRGPWLEPSGLTKWHGAYYVNGQARGQWSVQGEYARTLVTYMSYDFEHWSPAGSLGFRRDTLPPRPIPFFSEGQDDGEQVHLGASVWNRGNVIVGFYGMWHGSPTNDRRLVSVDIGLVVSHDALHYWEPIPDFRIVASRENVYAPGFPYVRAPSIAQGEGFENVGDETLFWYSSWGPFPGDGIRLARWERDRLGYLQMFGATEPALLVSAPISTGGKPVAIELNAGGLGQWTSAKVSVLDEQMNVLPGYDAADCTGPSTAGLRQRVVWGSRDTVTAPGPFRLRIDFAGVRPEDLRLYAIYVRPIE